MLPTEPTPRAPRPDLFLWLLPRPTRGTCRTRQGPSPRGARRSHGPARRQQLSNRGGGRHGAHRADPVDRRGIVRRKADGRGASGRYGLNRQRAAEHRPSHAPRPTVATQVQPQADRERAQRQNRRGGCGQERLGRGDAQANRNHDDRDDRQKDLTNPLRSPAQSANSHTATSIPALDEDDGFATSSPPPRRPTCRRQINASSLDAKVIGTNSQVLHCQIPRVTEVIGSARGARR